MSLNLLVFLGSARESTPPHPARLGARVAAAIKSHLEAMGHGVTLVDPLDIPMPAAFKPHFAFAHGSAPPALDALATTISAADGHVMVSPEYNHSLSPALAHLLNHFGSQRFAYRPSLIVTYSAGQWGGVRAAVAMRAFLSELGCLPVSAMVNIPKAQDVFGSDGSYLPGVDPDHWQRYIDRGAQQFVWWADAARKQRAAASAPPLPKPFTRSPADRNAPG